ncbi:General secretory system II protein E domain protein [Leptothrix cholodnii SP-6]|uniref:General secretory system II protein E domain protein n=1 Tax=Leptothrix cholodnii (strain ATCC 51168 / LMG 8142 / SP-6) TaxID=395495 RepID=B1Y3Z9_LEPCP|nr:ATPase, T2SS/T4P/T4SS family [Leptothrix cholodnii]ACB33393.1 General secretory system II protein E domain protein [Leptothrix cholodnii SP-6]
MSQISLPSLSLVPTPDELRRGTGALPVQAPGKASASKKSFAWPTPPLAAYPLPVPALEPEPCEIEGRTGNLMAGLMVSFEPEEGLVRVQVPPERVPMALRFNQIRRLTLKRSLAPLSAAMVADAAGDPPDQVLAHHQSQSYTVQLMGGASMAGRTVGHVEMPVGLFLFAPLDGLGSVQRIFVPRVAIEQFQIGERLGQMLIEQQATTPEQLEQVLLQQQTQRQKKLGEQLVERQIVTPEQLLTALDKQARMPSVRLGEALVALGYLTDKQLQEALQLQRTDRVQPLGELLVEKGLVEGEQLRIALARKMGYPVVDVAGFPVDPALIPLLPAPAARRLQVLPLMRRGGRLVVAMHDASQQSVIEELQRLTQSHIAPTLAGGTGLAEAIERAYSQVTSDLIEYTPVDDLPARRTPMPPAHFPAAALRRAAGPSVDLPVELPVTVPTLPPPAPPVVVQDTLRPNEGPMSVADAADAGFPLISLEAMGVEVTELTGLAGHDAADLPHPVDHTPTQPLAHPSDPHAAATHEHAEVDLPITVPAGWPVDAPTVDVTPAQAPSIEARHAEPAPVAAPSPGKPVPRHERQAQAAAADAEASSRARSSADRHESPLLQTLANLVLDALGRGASSVQIETLGPDDKLQVRLRRNGRLEPHTDLPATYRVPLIARIKALCELDVSETRRPQEGRLAFGRLVPQHKIDLRVHVLPTQNGLEDVVIGLPSRLKPMALDALGMAAPEVERLKGLLDRPAGLILCVGPARSGRTTSLHASLAHLNRPERRIWTLEDRIELTQPGLRQMQVHPDEGQTYESGLRTLLNTDADVLMVGHIGDVGTARVAVDAALQGRLVIGAMTGRNACDAVMRLMDQGVTPWDLSDALLGVHSQRLLRRMCSACRMSRSAKETEIEEWVEGYFHGAVVADPLPEREALLRSWLERFGREGRLRRFQSPGCERCGHTGQRGRLAVHELLVVTRELRRLIRAGAPAWNLQRQAQKDGMRTLRQEAVEKMVAGQITLDEVRTVLDL